MPEKKKKKKKRGGFQKCSLCKKSGHNRATCPVSEDNEDFGDEEFSSQTNSSRVEYQQMCHLLRNLNLPFCLAGGKHFWPRSC